MSHVVYEKWKCRPVRLKKSSCLPVEFKKSSCRPVEFKKSSCRMSLKPKKGHVAVTVLGVYTPILVHVAITYNLIALVFATPSV